MKKTLIILLIALMVPASLFASRAGTLSLGLEAGYTLGLYDQKGGSSATTYSPGHAFGIGVPLEYHFTNWLSFASGLFYEGRAYGSERMYEDELVFNLRNTEHFFDVPVALRLSLDNGVVRGFIGAGVYLGWRFRSTEDGKSMILGAPENTSGVIELNPNADNIFDSGFLAELGGGVRFGNRSEMYIAARYKYSFTALDKNYQDNMINRYLDTFSVSIGYNILIGNGDYLR